MDILQYPDPRLTFPNKTLGAWSEDSAKKVDQMWVVLARTRGLGLAAPQIGWNVKLFILSIPQPGGGKKEQVIFDPVMEPAGVTKMMDEGCLSFPMMFGSILRYDSVRITGMTTDGPMDEVVTDLEAQAVQHEMDHLNGILYIEKMTPADRKRNASAIRELEESWRRQHPNE
jgi:peptide deformylase